MANLLILLKLKLRLKLVLALHLSYLFLVALWMGCYNISQKNKAALSKRGIYGAAER